MWFLLSIIAAFFYASLWLFTRASKGIPSSVVTTLQFVIGPVLLLTCWNTPFPWSEPIWYWYLLISFCIVPPFSLALNFASQRIEVTLIKPLSGLSSLSAVLLPVLLFHQTIAVTGILGVAIGTLGLLILYHAKWHVWKTPYPWIVLCTMLIFGVNAAIVSQTLQIFPHPILLCFISHTGIFLFAFVGSLKQWKKISWSRNQIVLMIVLSCVTLLQEFATNIALGLTHAGYVVSVKRTSIIIASMAGYFFFHERSIKLPRLLAATSLVVGGVVMLLI